MKRVIGYASSLRLTVNACDIQLALARHYDPTRNLMLFEVPVRSQVVMQRRNDRMWEDSVSYLADCMVITPQDYATEIEIKVSLGDWKSDAAKDKWIYGLPDWISRFVYAVPVALGIPTWVPARCGVLHLYESGHGVRAEVARAPARFGKIKVPPEIRQYILNRTYARYWERQFARLSVLVAGDRPIQDAA